MRLFIIRSISGREAGVGLIETVVAVAILGIVAATFLTGVAITSKATFTTDEQATAESLARSQMEWAQNAGYVPNATGYTAAPIPGGSDYINYSADITAGSVTGGYVNIQKITVTVTHYGKKVITLQSYKVNR